MCPLWGRASARPEVTHEPLPRQLRHALQRARLLEQVRGAGDDLQSAARRSSGRRRPAFISMTGPSSPPTMSSVGAFTFGSAAPARSGRPPRETTARDPLRDARRGHQRRAAAGDAPKQPDVQLAACDGSRASQSIASTRRPASRSMSKRRCAVRVVAPPLPRGVSRSIEQRAEAAVAQRLRHVAVARAEAAASRCRARRARCPAAPSGMSEIAFERRRRDGRARHAGVLRGARALPRRWSARSRRTRVRPPGTAPACAGRRPRRPPVAPELLARLRRGDRHGDDDRARIHLAQRARPPRAWSSRWPGRRRR